MHQKDRGASSPRQRIAAECERRGRPAVIAGCVSLLRGGSADADLVVALGGAPARWAVNGGTPGPDYWLRAWAARGLLWTWDDAALPCILAALEDEAWRVREMALKVVARHRLTEALPLVSLLRADPVARVASTADRAWHRLTEGRDAAERPRP